MITNLEKILLMGHSKWDSLYMLYRKNAPEPLRKSAMASDRVYTPTYEYTYLDEIWRDNFEHRKVNGAKMSLNLRKHIRITVVGDGTTGKTCLLIVYKDKKFENYYIPTVFDSYSMNIRVHNQMCTVILQDTAGQEEYDRLRPLAYPETDVFVICFAIDNRNSYKNVYHKWNPEIRHHRPNAKIILVGTKCDLRSECDNPISTKEGEAMRLKIKANGYVECSSKFMWNVSRVFEEALLSIVGHPRPVHYKNRHSSCTLL